MKSNSSGSQTTLVLERKAPRIWGQTKNLSCGSSSIPGIAPGPSSENYGSGSSQRGRCRRGRSEIPHFSSKLQLFAPCSSIKCKKAKKSANKGEIPHQKSEEKRQKAYKKGRLPPAPSTPTPLRISQMDVAFRKSLCEFQQLLREYFGTLRQLREWPFQAESSFSQNCGQPVASELWCFRKVQGPLGRSCWIVSGRLFYALAILDHTPAIHDYTLITCALFNSFGID